MLYYLYSYYNKNIQLQFFFFLLISVLDSDIIGCRSIHFEQEFFIILHAATIRNIKKMLATLFFFLILSSQKSLFFRICSKGIIDLYTSQLFNFKFIPSINSVLSFILLLLSGFLIQIVILYFLFLFGYYCFIFFYINFASYVIVENNG